MSKAELTEWSKICDSLLSISDKDLPVKDLKAYIEMVPQVARFSFSVSDLPTLREKIEFHDKE